MRIPDKQPDDEKILPSRDGFGRGRRDPCEMKPQASLPFRPSRTLLLGLALSLASLPLHAQDSTPPQAVEVGGQPVVITDVPAQAKIIPRVQFQGSNLGEVVEFVEQQTQANLMIAPEVKSLAVPDIKILNVTGIGLLRAISDMGVPFQITETPPETPGEAPVWVISPRATAPEVQTNVTRIFSLRDAQIPFSAGDPMKPEVFDFMVRDISDAINVALQAREEATKGKGHYPVLKVHPSTRLMIVSGNQQEVEIAQQVICALGGTPVR
jgi:hypothetical protein